MIDGKPEYLDSTDPDVWIADKRKRWHPKTSTGFFHMPNDEVAISKREEIISFLIASGDK